MTRNALSQLSLCLHLALRNNLRNRRRTAFAVFVTTVGIVAVAPGKLTKASGKYGYKLTVDIPEEPAQQYPTGNYNGLEKLSVSLGAGKGRNALVTSVGCKARKHPFKSAIHFTNNPGPPTVPSVETTANARCK